ncbi:MAG: CxxC-x17-CxxC domain-containing protein [Candidatus Uhrbacteria bacterium]
MGNFNRGGGQRFGGSKSYGGGGGGSKRFTEMHKATCGECGADCEVPFRPTGDRPVFCSSCFGKQNDSGSGRPSRFGDDRRERPSFEDRQMHDAVCAKCGNDCQVPFRPTAGKPIFCNNCFEKPDRSARASGGQDSGEVMTQIKMLNEKMDKLIKILSPNVPVEKAAKPEVKKEIVVKEVTKVPKEKVEKIKTKTAVKKAPAKKKK